MSAEHELPKGLEPKETTALLQRILRLLEKNDREPRLGIAFAVLLGLATMASAWCAYQASLWSGVQTFRLVAASRASRESTQQTLTAHQLQTVDLQVLLSYLEAKGRGDQKLTDFMRARFRPEARKALDAWMQTDPFNNPDAPLRPFQMPEYVQPELQAASHADEEQARMMIAAQQANGSADKYVLLTVLFACVLFFAGIGGTFQSERLSISAFVIAAALFGVTVIAMGILPICRE